ncbi:MAG TPA: rRNA maturation RNase YbeY, partial [Gemmata sp.]|nr:rRNA maturation RNase YbeY [Gemmata sp.]
MLRISVANPYEYSLDFQRLKEVARTVLEGEGVRACKVTLAFVDNAHIHRLNKQFLEHDEPTDVLTFPYTEPDAKSLEGEVVTGYEVAKENAADRGHELNLELLLYVIHGCLHLCGY